MQDSIRRLNNTPGNSAIPALWFPLGAGFLTKRGGFRKMETVKILWLLWIISLIYLVGLIFYMERNFYDYPEESEFIKFGFFCSLTIYIVISLALIAKV